jgi:hypothetical protein
MVEELLAASRAKLVQKLNGTTHELGSRGGVRVVKQPYDMTQQVEPPDAQEKQRQNFPLASPDSTNTK